MIQKQLGEDNYPSKTADVLKILDNFKQEWAGGKPPTRNNSGHNITKSNGMNFLQSKNEGIEIKYLKGTNNSFFPNTEK